MTTKAPAANDRRWATAHEVAAETGLCLDTVYRMVRRGELLARKFGRAVRILRADVAGPAGWGASGPSSGALGVQGTTRRRVPQAIER